MPDQPPVAALSVDQDENIEQIDTLAGQRSAPDEVVSPSTDEEYIEYRKLTDYREPYRSVSISPSPPTAPQTHPLPTHAHPQQNIP